jgi:hypothetical protein
VTRAAVLLWAAAALFGCMGTTQRREDVLIENSRTFNDDWRWGRWDAMAGAMVREEGTAFLTRAQNLESELMLADFEVTSINFQSGSETATVIARFEWYLKRDPTVRNTTIEQLWKFQDGRWMVAKLRRTRGDRFGLVTEPASPLPSGVPAAPAPAP